MNMQIGRVVLNEGTPRPFEEEWSDTGRTVTLSGIQFSTPPSTRAAVAAMHDDVLGLPLNLVAVQFDVKDHRNGYYQAIGAKSSLIEIPGQQVIQLTWEITLTKLGNEQELDIESRLAGPINRLNEHELGGERWHAPAGGAVAYYAGSSTPGETVRMGSEGPIVVYRGLTQTDNPRWACLVEGYGAGRARVTDATGERSGSGVDLTVSDWSLGNSLVRFDCTLDGMYELYTYGAEGWSTPKVWDLTFNGSNLGTPLAVSVLHNTYERVTLRLVWDRTPNGRIYLDLTIRRGARYVEGLMRANAAGLMGVVRRDDEAGYLASGFVRATSNDVDGNRYVIGSREAFTDDLTAGGIAMTSTTRFDFIIGTEVDGEEAIDGDAGLDLMRQYIGTPEERVQGVRR